MQPLLDAGLDADEVCELLFRLAFEAIVEEWPDRATGLADLARNHPPAVHRAWVMVLDRMLSSRDVADDAG